MSSKSKVLHKTAIKPSTGYRLLKTNEVIREGDSYRTTSRYPERWEKVRTTIGKTVKTAKAENGFVAVRRKIKIKAEAATPSPTLEAPLGFKVGDHVALTCGSYTDTKWNPKWGGAEGYTVGRVATVYPASEYPYAVKWLTDHSNLYRETDLTALANAPTPDAGEGYRLLGVKELPESGDEYVSFSHPHGVREWTPIPATLGDPSTVAQRRMNIAEKASSIPAPFAGLYFRRKIAAPASPVPAGYRLLWDNEQPKSGDRYWNKEGLRVGLPLDTGLRYSSVAELKTLAWTSTWLGVLRPCVVPEGYRLLDRTEELEVGDVYLTADMQITEDTVSLRAGETLEEIRKDSSSYDNVVAIARKLPSPQLYTKDDLDRAVDAAVDAARKAERDSIISLIRGV